MTDEAPEAYEPPKNISRKSQEDLDRLNLAGKNNFLFAHLHPEQKSLIFAVMEKMLVGSLVNWTVLLLDQLLVCRRVE